MFDVSYTAKSRWSRTTYRVLPYRIQLKRIKEALYRSVQRDRELLTELSDTYRHSQRSQMIGAFQTSRILPRHRGLSSIESRRH